MYDAVRLARIDWTGRVLLAAVTAFCLATPFLGGIRINYEGSAPVLVTFAVLFAIAWVYRPEGRNVPASHSTARSARSFWPMG